MAEELPRVIHLEDGEVYAFIDDDVIMLKATSLNDPAELNDDSAVKLAEWLLAWAARLDVSYPGPGA